MKKKGIVPIAIIAIFIIGIMGTVFGAELMFPGSVLPAITGTHDTCSDTPFDSKCICSVGTQKISNLQPFGRFFCQTPPQVGVSFPIETWGEAFAYLNQQTNIQKCPSNGYIQVAQEGLNSNTYLKEGFNGRVDQSASILMECYVDESGYRQMFWRFWFRPATGQILQSNF